MNPGIRDPDLPEPAPATTPGRVVVIGGGVAGLDAARGAALRGHSVVLFERRPELGGRARLAGARRGRERWARTSTGCATRRTPPEPSFASASRRTADAVVAEAPDAVILASGSELRPSAALPGPVPAIDVDVLLEHGAGEVRARSALVLDDEGGFLAPTATERLVADGFTVEIATAHPVVGAEIDPTQQPFLLRRLALAGVVMTPHLTGVSSDAGGVTLRNIYSARRESAHSRATAGACRWRGRLGSCRCPPGRLAGGATRDRRTGSEAASA